MNWFQKKQIKKVNWTPPEGLEVKLLQYIAYLLMNSVIPIQVTQSKADIVPMLLDVLSWAAHAPIHTDVV